jgi:hypothetical protein
VQVVHDDAPAAVQLAQVGSQLVQTVFAVAVQAALW